MHSSVRLMSEPIEFINVTPINPLISKCQIKVCYVGEQPNRNGSIITKEVATEMANSLPGSPIVGFYNEEAEDFEEHNRDFEIKDGKFELKDTTKPYGFVDLNAKVWFAKYLDDDSMEHEYLMTEGWLWTGQYPEAKRILEKGNNQSMELDENSMNAQWSKDNNGNPEFFIINEAIISKLCILGEDYEPCFEGANVTSPVIQFSFSNNFEKQIYSMMTELKDLINGGGKEVDNEMKEEATEEKVEKVAENQDNFDEVIDNNTDYKLEDNNLDENVEEKAVEESTEVEESAEKNDSQITEPEATYSLDEIPEYVELQNRFNDLETKFNALSEEKENLEKEIAPLKEFKLASEKKEKEDMIARFYMLSDEDKQDVITNIDKYSLDDIEAKLSILCVRNKVNFNLDDENEDKAEKSATTFNLENSEEDSVPAWVKAVMEVEKELN